MHPTRRPFEAPWLEPLVTAHMELSVHWQLIEIHPFSSLMEHTMIKKTNWDSQFKERINWGKDELDLARCIDFG